MSRAPISEKILRRAEAVRETWPDLIVTISELVAEEQAAKREWLDRCAVVSEAIKDLSVASGETQAVLGATIGRTSGVIGEHLARADALREGEPTKSRKRGGSSGKPKPKAKMAVAAPTGGGEA